MWEEALAGMGVSTSASGSKNQSGSKNTGRQSANSKKSVNKNNQSESSQFQNLEVCQQINESPRGVIDSDKKNSKSSRKQNNSQDSNISKNGDKLSSKKRKRNKIQENISTNNEQSTSKTSYQGEDLINTSAAPNKPVISQNSGQSESLSKTSSKHNISSDGDSGKARKKLKKVKTAENFVNPVKTIQPEKKQKKTKKKLQAVADLLEEEEQEQSISNKSKNNRSKENNSSGETNSNLDKKSQTKSKTKKSSTPTPSPSNSIASSKRQWEPIASKNQKLNQQQEIQYQREIQCDGNSLQNRTTGYGQQLQEFLNNQFEDQNTTDDIQKDTRLPTRNPDSTSAPTPSPGTADQENSKQGKGKQNEQVKDIWTDMLAQYGVQSSNSRSVSRQSSQNNNKGKTTFIQQNVDQNNLGNSSWFAGPNFQQNQGQNIKLNESPGKKRQRGDGGSSSPDSSSSINNDKENEKDDTSTSSQRKKQKKSANSPQSSDNYKKQFEKDDVIEKFKKKKQKKKDKFSRLENHPQENQSRNRSISNEQSPELSNSSSKENSNRKEKKKKEKKSMCKDVTNAQNVQNVNTNHVAQEENEVQLDTNGIREEIQPLKDIWTETLEKMGVVNQSQPMRKIQRRTYIKQQRNENENTQQNNTQQDDIDNNEQNEITLDETPQSERWRNFFIGQQLQQMQHRMQSRQSPSLIQGVGGLGIPTFGGQEIPPIPTPTPAPTPVPTPSEADNINISNQQQAKKSNQKENQDAQFEGIQCDFIEAPRKKKVRRRRRYKRPILYQQKDQVWWYSLRHGYIQPKQIPGQNPHEAAKKKWLSYEKFLIRQYASKVRHYQHAPPESFIPELYNLQFPIPEGTPDDSFLREYMNFQSLGATDRRTLEHSQDVNRPDIKQGYFSAHETAVLDAAFKQQLKNYHIPLSRWEEAYSRGKDMKYFWKDLACNLPHRTVDSLKRKVYVIYSQLGMKRGPYSKEEDEQLLKLVQQMGPDWREIGKIMKRFHRRISDRYKHITSYYKTGRWTEEEVQLLDKLVKECLINKSQKSGYETDGGFQDTDWEGEEDGNETEFEDANWKFHRMNGFTFRDNINWSEVARLLGHRSKQACLWKYYYTLAPSMVDKGDWGKGEDRIMLYEMAASGAKAEFQVDWDNLVRGRDRYTTQRRWKLMKKAIPFHRDKPFRFLLHSLIDQFCPEVAPALNEEDNDNIDVEENDE